ncbi:hypothetical protein GE061_018027 [Apolygus lucorum]|uniref:Uncharacterized protein n=1 Tax=Apolygus lucorum TaxID=248454 RepID=A0A8S9XEQ7_APOLU|nr:hypothetical protein GE061_018027 [Apolygus lucorum]
MKRKLQYFYLPKKVIEMRRSRSIPELPSTTPTPPPMSFLCFFVIDCKITYVPLKNSISSYLPGLTKSEV